MAGARTWPLAAAWAASVEVTAAAYGVAPALLTTRSQGRGPRPPEKAREPKKVAIFLLVVLSGAEYAGAGRFLGLHRDTVASHCAEVRGWADDETVERNLDVLAAAARVKLDIHGQPTRAGGASAERLAALEAFMAGVFARARAGLASGAALSDEAPDTSSDSREKSRACDLGRVAA